MSGKITDISMVAGKVDGHPFFEKLPAEQLDGHTFRLMASPGFANGFAKHDVIKVDPSCPTGFCVQERSGNICVQIFYAGSKEQARTYFSSKFEAIGGSLDGGNDGSGGHLLIYNVPVSVGFKAIEAVLANPPLELRVENWMYGNVYDEVGEPLNWWLNK
jgi:hypothetical protein